MHSKLKKVKEKQILDAVEQAIQEYGIANLSMNHIAEAAGITKVTLYNYFQSKDNLYLAVMHRAFEQIVENYYATIDQYKNQSGLECTLAILESIYKFFQENKLYSDAMLDYFALIRKSHLNKSNNTDLYKSLYFNKLQDLQDLPLKLTAKQIERGINDGSINQHVNPMLYAIQGWSMVIGYIKLISAAGKNEKTLYNVDLTSLKDLSLQIAKDHLSI